MLTTFSVYVVLPLAFIAYTYDMGWWSTALMATGVIGVVADNVL